VRYDHEVTTKEAELDDATRSTGSSPAVAVTVMIVI
jgi:hypothetical protein